jgi:hypothetical protein
MLPFVIWIARAGTIAWGSWWAFWKLKEETYEGAVLTAINDDYNSKTWYTERGLTESQVYQIIARFRYYIINKILEFPKTREDVLEFQKKIGADLNFPANSRPYSGIFVVIAALMARIKPETETLSTSAGTLYEYIRGGVTKSDAAINLPVDIIKRAGQEVVKIEDSLPWFLKSKNLTIIAAVGGGIYLFGPAIRKQLRK